MAATKLKNLKPGMILDRDVEDLNGRMLLTQGTKINEKHLKILKTWGVTEVTIREARKTLRVSLKTNQPDSELLKKLETELTELFSQANTKNPMMKELYNQCLERKLKMHDEAIL